MEAGDGRGRGTHETRRTIGRPAGRRCAHAGLGPPARRCLRQTSRAWRAPEKAPPPSSRPGTGTAGLYSYSRRRRVSNSQRLSAGATQQSRAPLARIDHARGVSSGPPILSLLPLTLFLVRLKRTPYIFRKWPYQRARTHRYTHGEAKERARTHGQIMNQSGNTL